MKKYNEIKSTYMEKAKQQLTKAKKVEVISAIAFVVFGAISAVLVYLGIHSLVRLFGVIALAVSSAIAFCVYWQEDTDISAAPYKNALNVLSLYCNEIEDNGFDASSYREIVIASRKKVQDLIHNPDKPQHLINRDLDYLERKIEFLEQVMQENFDNYEEKPENTEMQMKSYKVNLNEGYRFGPDYDWEKIELACPVKKAEVQTNEQNQAGGQAVQGREESRCSTEP